MGPMPGKFKPGDVKWLPGGYTHTPHLNECRPEPGKISDGGILESSCGDGKFVWGGRPRPSKPSAARQPPGGLVGERKARVGTGALARPSRAQLGSRRWSQQPLLR